MVFVVFVGKGLRGRFLGLTPQPRASAGWMLSSEPESEEETMEETVETNLLLRMKFNFFLKKETLKRRAPVLAYLDHVEAPEHTIRKRSMVGTAEKYSELEFFYIE